MCRKNYPYIFHRKETMMTVYDESSGNVGHKFEIFTVKEKFFLSKDVKY